jgi:uncharacterized protein DUF6285
MRDKPSGAELVALAEALGEAGVLAERCHAIAAREQAAGEGAFAPIRAALAAHYGAGDDKMLLARLADDIRAGALDEGSNRRAALAALLVAITRQKLAESSPGYWEGL